MNDEDKIKFKKFKCLSPPLLSLCKIKVSGVDFLFISFWNIFGLSLTNKFKVRWCSFQSLEKYVLFSG